MKRINRYKMIACGVLGLLQFSCSKDMGNYAYHEINEIEISNLEDSYSYRSRVDSFNLTPMIRSSLTSDTTGRYEYNWVIYEGQKAKTGEAVGQVLSRSKDLRALVNLSPQDYYLYFKVKDRQTQVEYSKGVIVNVSSIMQKGFLLGGDKPDGSAGADFVSLSTDTVLIKDILAEKNISDLRGVISLVHTGDYFRPDNVKVWLMTETGSCFFRTPELNVPPKNRIDNYIFTTFQVPKPEIPIQIAPAISGPNGRASNNFQRLVMTKAGNVYKASLFEGDFYSNPVNTLPEDRSKLFKSFGYMFYAFNRISNVILYDTDNNRFVKLSSLYDTEVEAMADGDTDLFPWNQTDRVLIYGENTKERSNAGNGNSFALMKDDTDNFFIYKFYCSRRFTKNGFYSIKKDLATDINKAHLFAFSSMRTVLLYAVGSKLYAYDYNSGLERCQMVLDLGHEITCLKFDTQSVSRDYYELFIATYDGNSGRLRKYVLSDNPDSLEVEPIKEFDFSGLHKVKSIEYRNSIK